MKENMSKIERFNKLELLLLELRAVYPQANMSDSMIAVYCADLIDVNVGVLEEALKRIRRKSKFLPTIAEIFEEVHIVWGEVREDQDRSSRNYYHDRPSDIPCPKEILDQMKETLKRSSLLHTSLKSIVEVIEGKTDDEK